MALFGGNVSSWLTPDGRQVSMPQDLAVSFPGLQPVQPPTLPATSQDQRDLPSSSPQETSPVQGVGPVTSPSEPPSPPQPQQPPTGGPVTSPSQVPSGTGSSGPRGPVTTPGQAVDPGAGSVAAPITTKQLQEMGAAGAANREIQAQEESRQAVRKQGEALANQATAVGDTMATADAEANRLLQQRAQVANEQAAAMQAKTEEYFRNAKAIADTKIDRSIDHPVLAALGVVLRSIGGAMQHKSGDDVMDPLYKAIDRKVAAQMQDLDKRRGDLAMQRDALGMQREQNRDRLQELDTYRLAYLEQAKRQVETIKQRTQSDVIRANTDLAIAGINEKQASIISGAQSREQQKMEAEAARKQALQIHRESMGVQIRGQNMQQREADLNRAERAQEKLDAIAAQITLAKGKGSEELAKKISEQGLIDPTTGDLMLTPEGQKKLAQADQLEAQARAAKDPAQAQKLNEAAAQYRESARANDIALALNKEDRATAQKAVNSANDLNNAVNEARDLLQKGPEAWNREEWARFKVLGENVKAKFATMLGERLSVRALEAFDNVLSIDPDSVWSRAVDKGKAIQALETLQDQVNQQAGTAVRGAGVKSGWTGPRPPVAPSFAGKTSQEVGDDAKPGVASRALTHVLYPLGGADERIQATQDRAMESANARRGAKGQTSDYGLDPDVDDTIRGIVKQSAKVGHAEYNRLVGKLREPLESGRESLAAGTARLIRDQDPKLFSDVMKSLPELTRTAIEQDIAPPDASLPVGALTPEARADLTIAKARADRGIPVEGVRTQPLTGTATTPPPPIWNSLTAAGKKQYNEYLVKNGFPPVGAP